MPAGGGFMDQDMQKPFVWIIDSPRSPLAGSLYAFEDSVGYRYFSHGEPPSPDLPQPDAVFFSAEIEGGPTGELFSTLVENNPAIPLLAITKVRSLTQAVAFFRAGALDYLSLPLDPDEVAERLDASLVRIADLVAAVVTVELESLGDGVESELLSALQEEGMNLDADLEELSGDLGENDEAENDDSDDIEAVPVDGLPIPSLWEELPCGLLVFDSQANLVYANASAFTLLGFESMGELQDMLGNKRSEFNALATNKKPLPDNKWPHIAAVKTRTERHATISVERPDKTRVWLRMDCLPHLADGALSRLTMTLVNMTGEMPKGK